ncbi:MULTISPECIES: hypothetical protein [unclassified Kitasatospora]|uniref:hypothetical protein n=1 Tax=unclassified Kitasatospora TaxID=2633591 RepID=UPI0024730115|nr:hypothetical protein [Kitasatospora sp. GAS204B]
MRRFLGQLLLPIGLVAAATIPAQAATPTGGLNPCVVQAICLVVGVPGSPGSTGGPTGSPGSGGGEATCTFNKQQYPCWDADLGWFDSEHGCYETPEDPQPPADDKSWGGNSPNDGSVYLVSCVDGTVSTKFLNKPPNIGAPPPSPATVALIAFKKLPFLQPTPHSAPTGQALVGVPVWLWYDVPNGTQAETVGPMTINASLDGVSVDATATLTDVSWDLGYRDPATGKEAVVDCPGKGAGHPYQPGLEQNPPADACLATFGSLSVNASGSPAPTAKASAGASGVPAGSFSLVVTQTWTVHTQDMINGGEPWGPVQVSVSSNPMALQVSGLQVLN